MTDIELPLVERVQVAEVRPGDLVVVTLPEHVTQDGFHQIVDGVRLRFEEWFPDARVLFVTAGVDVAVVREGEPE